MAKINNTKKVKKSANEHNPNPIPNPDPNPNPNPNLIGSFLWGCEKSKMRHDRAS